MSGVVKIEIWETEEELKALLGRETNAHRHEKLQVLYWLKTQTVETLLSAAVRLGKHRTTVQRWLSSYLKGGIEELLLQKTSSGRPRIMNPETVEKLSKELLQPEGFSSYKEVHQWLTSCCEVKVAYRTVHQWARYRLKGKLKVPRPVSEKQKAGAVEEFKKKLSSLIKGSLSQSESFLKQWKKARYWSEDESRMGLHTIQRRKLTARGIKPQGKVQWDFIYLWLYGAVEPLTGEEFFYEFTHLDTVCFEKFLELFASKYPEDLHIIQVDNGGFHNSLNLSIPENIILLFPPAYSPEVNPIERL
jgi:transposase